MILYIVYFVAFLALGKKVLICSVDISYYCTYPELFNINYLIKHRLAHLFKKMPWIFFFYWEVTQASSSYVDYFLSHLISFRLLAKITQFCIKKNSFCFGKILRISLLWRFLFPKNEFLIITFPFSCNLSFSEKALTAVLSQTNCNILRNALKGKNQTNVTPILKKVKKDPRNYRPASLTLISGKMMKQLILETISRHVKHKNIIRSGQ